jgi:hypothetical protein
MQFSEILAPLEPLRDDVFVPMGLYQEGHRGNQNHVHRCPIFLSHGAVGTDWNSNPVVRTTIDQLMANRVGQDTPIASLALAIEPVQQRITEGVSYTSCANISWTSPTSALPREIHPALAFDRIVGARQRNRHDQSVLDFVLDDARSLRNAVSRADRQRLDEYLESVREIEQRISRAGDRTRPQGWTAPAYTEDMMRRPAANLPTSMVEHMRLLYDILHLAFRTNSTRVATYMLNNEVSELAFSFLDGVSGTLHDISHHSNTMLAKINLYQTGLFAEFLQKLKRTPEANGTLLDNCMVQYGCCMWTGNHDAPVLPIVVAGKGGGTIATGQAIDYSERANRDLTQLYLAFMDRMGVNLNRFGPTASRLPGFSREG